MSSSSGRPPRPTAGRAPCASRDGNGLWRAIPVEYKRGRPKSDLCDAVQVGAQAMCLEEMLGGDVLEAALFYGSPRRRTPVAIDSALRAEVESAARRLHKLIGAGLTPPARYEKKCDSCSLVDVCLPRLGTRRRSVRDYLARSPLKRTDRPRWRWENEECDNTGTLCTSRHRVRAVRQGG